MWLFFLSKYICNQWVPLLWFCVAVSRYESVIATLCENLDSLDEPEARAAMIWIVGEYAERIDNADELLESFLEGFHDESTQVCLEAFGNITIYKLRSQFTFCADSSWHMLVSEIMEAAENGGHIQYYYYYREHSFIDMWYHERNERILDLFNWVYWN